MKRLLSQIIAGILGLYIASFLVPGFQLVVLSDSSFFGISLTAVWELFVILGIILGLLNYFVKPILEVISLPLEIITLGLFTFVINIFLVWVVDAIFKELTIPLWLPLLYVTLIIFVLSMVFSMIFKKHD